VGPVAGRNDGVGLPIREEPDRDRALGDRVGQVAPGVDQRVELLVEDEEARADDAPVELLAEEGEVDELDGRRLQPRARPRRGRGCREAEGEPMTCWWPWRSSPLG
jgi:hypothetical protein